MGRSGGERDPIRPRAYFRKVAARHAKLIAKEASRRYMRPQTPRDALTVAMACYSGGAPVAVVDAWLEHAAGLFDTFMRQWDDRPEAGPDCRTQLELLAGARLIGVGRMQALLAHRRRCVFDTPLPPVLESLFVGVTTAFAGQAPGCPDDAEAHEADRIHVYYGSVARLLQRMADGGKGGFQAALNEYLSTGWARLADTRLDDLDDSDPKYSGRWDLVAAALCVGFGRVADVHPDAMRFVPVELVHDRG